ncbi:MAG: vanadium-dependent haloperoxidase [Phycisphaerales bacterium]
MSAPLSVRALSITSLMVLSAVGASADVVTEWNSTYLDIIRQTGGAPCPISRDGPMFTLAMYDAINSIDRANNPGGGFESYQASLPSVAAGTSREAAGAAAAYTVMSSLHASSPANLALIQSRYDAQLAAIPDSPAKTAGVAHGVAVANGLLTQRQNDGYNADPSYTPGGHAGDWRVTPDGPNVQPFTPHWGNVTPWGLQTPSQFRPTRLTDFGSMDNLMHSPEYAEQINGGPGVPGVRSLGERNSATRTADETQAAWFWANDRDGTSKPPGQLIQITQAVSAQQGLDLSANARLFGLVGLALGDACVSAWDSKYNTPIDLWRPIDAIRETMDDGNALTTPDGAWLPLNDFTPPFPAYVSGHATFGAAHAAIMRSFFGTDNITFTIGSDEFAVNPGLGYAPDLTRTFTSFSDAAWENAMSRVWLGVHFYWDALDGNILGTQVGDYAYANYLRPVPAPGAAVVLAFGAAIGLRRRRN